MNTDDSIEEISITLKEAKEQIAFAEALERLQKNPDFIKVIEEGYLKKEAIRLVHSKAIYSDVMQDEKTQKMILKDIDAIGSLINYFNMQFKSADMAKQTLKAGNDEIDLIRSEIDVEDNQ